MAYRFTASLSFPTLDRRLEDAQITVIRDAGEEVMVIDLPADVAREGTEGYDSRTARAVAAENVFDLTKAALQERGHRVGIGDLLLMGRQEIATLLLPE